MYYAADKVLFLKFAGIKIFIATLRLAVAACVRTFNFLARETTNKPTPPPPQTKIK